MSPDAESHAARAGRPRRPRRCRIKLSERTNAGGKRCRPCWIETQSDLVFFGFWLTHVPKKLFGSFWQKVARALKPGGRVFVIDNLPVSNFPSLDHSEEDPSTGTVTRHLEDGRSFRIVKIFYEPDVLSRMLEPAGWLCEFSSARRHLLFGSATRV